MRRALWFVVLLTTAVLLEGSSIPKGTKIHVRFQEFISSANARAGDRFTAVLVRDLKHPPEINVPAGAIVRGRVTKSQGAAADGATAGMIAVVIESIESGDLRYVFTTREIVRHGRAVSKPNSRDSDRQREVQSTIADTLGKVAHPDPKDIPGAGGDMQTTIELQGVEGQIPAHAELVFVTTSRVIKPDR